MGGQLGCSYLIAQWTYTCTPHTHTRTHERALIIIRMPPTNMPPVINMTQSGTTTSLRRGLLIVLQYVITAWAWSSMRSEYSVCSIHIGWTVQWKGTEFNSKLYIVAVKTVNLNWKIFLRFGQLCLFLCQPLLEARTTKYSNKIIYLSLIK